MSGEGGNSGGGYNQYSCFYRTQYNCPHFVLQNGDACGTCLSKGRPSPRESERIGDLSPDFGRLLFTEYIDLSGEGGNGGGGFNKYSCIYRYADPPCKEFVWQKGDACGKCLAKGRKSGRDTEEVVEVSPAIEIGGARYVLGQDTDHELGGNGDYESVVYHI